MIKKKKEKKLYIAYIITRKKLIHVQRIKKYRSYQLNNFTRIRNVKLTNINSQ